MIRKLRRPITAYIYSAFWIVLTLMYTTLESSDLAVWIFILAAVVWTVSFASILIKRNYFEIKDDRLIINNYFFRTQFVELNQIEKLTIDPGPFGTSKIILKDKTSIDYLDSHTDYDDLKTFMGQFNIPVE